MIRVAKIRTAATMETIIRRPREARDGTVLSAGNSR
jgi:hypothetical protein